ncbi:hypothetical protein [Kribbella kalugense]|uniref:Pyrroloquinoline-quinone binding quinoprotein n=1 Tax=Kribbella kalugense TaxID=2512221 RepID=A0A4R7ZRK3_9ACTN|nr:hypothetical protein [Kribbella kalugense]TDW18040.1 hypothetical protein EV650_4621 [Kribbella kalugense]
MAEKIPSWPKVTIRLYDDHNAEVKIAGRSHPINHHDPRQAAIQLVAERAAQLGRSVKATAVESDGASWPLVIHPDGQVEAVDADAARGRGSGGKKPIWPIVVAMVVACVLLIGTIVFVAVIKPNLHKKPVATTSPTLPSLPGPSVAPGEYSPATVPPGYSTHASWTVDLADGTNPAIKPDGTEVAILTTDQKVAVFDSNGKVLWQDNVPKDAENPVYTTIDSKLVLALTTQDSLIYWPGGGAESKQIALPDGAQVQFFGKSPLVTLSSTGGAMVVSGGELKAVPNQPRWSTILLAEGDRALMSLYKGPLFWSQPDKPLQTVQPQKPGGATAIQRVLAASPDYALVMWSTSNPDEVIPAVQSTASGKLAAVCPRSKGGDVEGWDWVPDPNRRIAAWGECLINFSTHGVTMVPDFQPESITGSLIYGRINSTEYVMTPGRPRHALNPAPTRPWGLAGNHAIVVFGSVLYALDPAKK